MIRKANTHPYHSRLIVHPTDQHQLKAQICAKFLIDHDRVVRLSHCHSLLDKNTRYYLVKREIWWEGARPPDWTGHLCSPNEGGKTYDVQVHCKATGEWWTSQRSHNSDYPDLYLWSQIIVKHFFPMMNEWPKLMVFLPDVTEISCSQILFTTFHLRPNTSVATQTPHDFLLKVWKYLWLSPMKSSQPCLELKDVVHRPGN